MFFSYYHKSRTLHIPALIFSLGQRTEWYVIFFKEITQRPFNIVKTEGKVKIIKLLALKWQ